MWILPKQLHISAYVADTKALGLDSEKFCRLCEKSLVVKSNFTKFATWLKRWKSICYMKPLSIRTLKPSHTKSFLERWTSCPSVFRANHSLLQEIVKELKIQDTYSHISQKELSNASQELYSQKMFRALLPPKQEKENLFSNMSCEQWKAWVTEQRQEYSQRVKLAHHTRENESSSLAWISPTTIDIERTEEGIKKRIAYRKSIGRKYIEGCLTEQVKNWATPSTMDMLPLRSREALIKQATTSRKGRKTPSNLREQVDEESVQIYKDVMNYPTPRTSDAEGGRIETEMTKKGFRSKRYKSNQFFGAKLRDAVESCNTQLDQMNHSTIGKSQESWATPRANKVHPKITEENRDRLANRNKSNLEEEIAGHCGKATGRLNPDWVEQLMGLPIGWTDLGHWGME